jgi:hypothetical protein
MASRTTTKVLALWKCGGKPYAKKAFPADTMGGTGSGRFSFQQP